MLVCMELMQCLAKVFKPHKLYSHCNDRLHWILLDLYLTDQHEVIHFYQKKWLKKLAVHLYSTSYIDVFLNYLSVQLKQQMFWSLFLCFFFKNMSKILNCNFVWILIRLLQQINMICFKLFICSFVCIFNVFFQVESGPQDRV